MNKKPFRILLVEDDANIREYIRTLINDSDAECAVVAEADNGADGVRIAKSIMPDIIITDILMPIKNGIELLDELSGYDFEAIVISAYDDFEYTRASLRHNVTDYLLKPVKPDELFRVLDVVCRKISDKAPRINSESLLQVQSYYIRDLLYNANSDNPNVLLELLPPVSAPYIAVVYLTSANSALLQSAVYDSFRDIIPIDFSPDGLFVIHSSNTPIDAQALCSRYKSAIDNELFTYIGIGVPKGAEENIITAIIAAYRCTEYQSVTDDARCFTLSRLPAPDCEVNEDKLYECFNELYQHLDNGDREKLEEVSDKLFIYAFFFGDFAHFKTLFMKFLFHLEQKYSSLFDVVQGPFGIDLKKCNNLIALKARAKDIFEQVMEQKESNAPKYHKLVLDAIALIRKNYASITIESASEALFISPSYLMYIFKKDTNESFNNYVINYRMTVAQQLLQDGKKVYEVSEAVGYKSVKFFSTIFKKKTGLSPSEYVKQHYR